MSVPSSLLAPRLALGETIGFFSPSSPVTVTAPERFKRAKSFLQQKGFVLQAGLRNKQIFIDLEPFKTVPTS